jgi:hypothetical protein
MEGTSDKTDDQADGKLQVDKLYIYTGCNGAVGASASGSAAPAPAPASGSAASAAPAGGGPASCNVGTKTSYSGCGSAMKDANTFTETKCLASATGCLTLQYAAASSGCSAGSAVGYCLYAGTNCKFYDKTYKDAAGFSDYACTECKEKNCNPMESPSAPPATTSSAQAAGACVLAALAVVSAM